MTSEKHESAKESYEIIHKEFKLAAIAAFVMLFGGAIVYHQIEKFSWVDSFYFCVTTLTTVGDNSVVLTTDFGKIFTIFYLIIGIGIIASFANLLIKNAMLHRNLKLENRRRKIK
jgi:hypothetical protein